MIHRLRTMILREDRVQIIYECRHCGTNLDREAERCPSCHSPDITTYETP